MAKSFADLQASVTANTNASRSMLAVLQGIVEKLKQCETVTDFETVTTELDASTKALTDAAVANTPAAPPA